MRKPHPGSVTFPNRPAICFLAHRNGTDQTSVSSTATINFTHTSFNVGGWFSTASGHFIVGQSGFMHFGAMAKLNTNIAANNVIVLSITKDGSPVAHGNQYADGGTPRIACEFQDRVTATMYFGVALSFISSTATSSIDGDEAQTAFWGHEITR